MRIDLILSLVACCAVASCGGSADSSDRRVQLAQQMVFMTPVVGDGSAAPLAPGPGTVYEIAVMNLDGSDFRQITHDGTFKFLPHVSPDATRIVYTKFATGGYGVPGSHADVAVYDLTTNQETLVTHGNGNVQGTWSPDGRQIAFLNFGTSVGADLGAIWIVNADGTSAHQVAESSGTPLDLQWGDIAWSSDNWLLFTVGQTPDHCVCPESVTCTRFNARTDKMLPDGSSRTQVTDGGPNCTPSGEAQSGDADPGWSYDGQTIYSSRGFPLPPAGATSGMQRRLYAFSNAAWYPGKPEIDLSLASQPDCIEGVPKGSPDGTRILLFRACFDISTPANPPGIFVSPADGSNREFIVAGFGPDWNPIAH